jgi:DNA (cytosine-5)-methyltransferase 1
LAAYYNEIDPYAADWLRRLIAARELPAGDVDERSITDVRPDDLRGYRDCHFFAGIGGWPLALKLAGWRRPAWTGSCPCQPYSVASVGHGGAEGQDDERHLWPPFFSLIRELRPATVFGEQVESAVGWGWLDEIGLDLEGEGYAVAAGVLRADAFGADHERKRLYWMADASGARWEGHQPVEGLPVAAPAPFTEHGDPLAGARRALDGDYSHLLPCDGLSVVLERAALKGYGNAIVPQVAAEFVRAYIDARQSFVNKAHRQGDCSPLESKRSTKEFNQGGGNG